MRRLLALLLIPLPAAAQEAPRLVFPVDCELGETCFIQQFLDRDPGPGARDFRCGPQSYDAHSGTDIRLPDRAALADGPSVRAAAPGTVRGARSSVPDTGIGGFPEGQDCGNGVVIDHEGGWQTQYCHMAQGSVPVAAGDVVEAGQPIGRIGFSGRTEFPHLHFSLRFDGADVDPFDPSNAATCGEGAAPLWAEEVEAAPGGILSAGFSDAVPEFEAIRDGTADADRLDLSGPAIVLWGFIHGGREGDILRLRIEDAAGGEFHAQEVVLGRTQAELFRASGRRNPGNLTPGDYTGTVTLMRDGAVIDTETVTISVD